MVYKELINTITIFTVALFVTIVIVITSTASMSSKEVETVETTTDCEFVIETRRAEPLSSTMTVPVEEPDLYSEADIELLALVTMAEAEGEPEEGKRLVIDTILNRVDSEHFPDTIHDVIYQKNQFTSMWNGRVDRCTVNDYVINLVREEVESRTNHDVIFFTAGAYGKYGTPMFQVGDHYFCKY